LRRGIKITIEDFRTTKNNTLKKLDLFFLPVESGQSCGKRKPGITAGKRKYRHCSTKKLLKNLQVIPVMSRQSSKNICSTGKVRPGISSAKKIALVLSAAHLNIKTLTAVSYLHILQWKTPFVFCVSNI
jgi:hypothetical protein